MGVSLSYAKPAAAHAISDFRGIPWLVHLGSGAIHRRQKLLTPIAERLIEFLQSVER